MRKKLGCITAAALAAAAGLATVEAGAAPSGEITVWSWNIAAEALDMLVPDFNKKYPDVKVTVVNMGNGDVYNKTLAGCAAGGTDLPDVVTIENNEAEIQWARFPDCFVNLKEFGVDKYLDAFPDFKWIELTAGDGVYSLPWDSGPTMVFYRRDIYEQAGVDPSAIQTWDDFIAAGKKILEATGGKVKMVSMDLAGDDGWFRALANQEACSYFDNAGETVTINQPGCVKALEMIKKMIDAGIVALGDWGAQIQNVKTGATASAYFGGWYEGTIRSNAPELSGKWGVYPPPALEPGGVRAANWGGSSLAITSSSKNKDAAWAYIEYALATDEGQISMLKNRGLVPSLLSATETEYAKSPMEYWGGQPIWTEMLATMDQIPPYRGTQFFDEVRGTIVIKAINDYLNGTYNSAQEALDAAAEQISSATGLPIAG
jgi:lactose/L-arabinose transport system substrate-binding protein